MLQQTMHPQGFHQLGQFVADPSVACALAFSDGTVIAVRLLAIETGNTLSKIYEVLDSSVLRDAVRQQILSLRALVAKGADAPAQAAARTVYTSADEKALCLGVALAWEHAPNFPVGAVEDAFSRLEDLVSRIQGAQFPSPSEPLVTQQPPQRESSMWKWLIGAGVVLTSIGGIFWWRTR